MYKTGSRSSFDENEKEYFVKIWGNEQLSSCISCPFLTFTSLSLSHVRCLLKIFYRVVADIAPGEELLLFMKSEDYSHETMAPDIHGQYHSPCRPPHPHLEIVMEPVKGSITLGVCQFPWLVIISFTNSVP